MFVLNRQLIRTISPKIPALFHFRVVSPTTAINQIAYRLSLILHFGHGLCDAVEQPGRHNLYLDCDCVVVQLATKDECDAEIINELKQQQKSNRTGRA